MKEVNLFMMLLGSKPPGRNTEQHDIFFTVAKELRDCVPDIKSFWPEAAKNIHIDAWRNVSFVNRHSVKVIEKDRNLFTSDEVKLFFINLGGYKAGEFEEYHYKQIIAAKDRASAIQQAKAAVFFRHHTSPHVDDKYGIDVDDIYDIEEILPQSVKERYSIVVNPAKDLAEDEIHLGYFKLDKL